MFPRVAARPLPIWTRLGRDQMPGQTDVVSCRPLIELEVRPGLFDKPCHWWLELWRGPSTVLEGMKPG